MNRLATAYLIRRGEKRSVIYHPPFARPRRFSVDALRAGADEVVVVRGHRKITALLPSSKALCNAVAKVEFPGRFAEQERQVLADYLHSGKGLVAADGFPVYRSDV